MSDAFAPTDYTSYLKKKIDFLERQISELMALHDPGGTLVIYPDWVQLKHASQPSNRPPNMELSIT